MQKGQSIIEIIIALALFIIIVGSSIVAILGSLTTTRLAEEKTQATMFATEGIEATKSIRNQDWDNLVTGNHGINSSGGTWAFSGTSDNPDSSEKFSRVITIENVERNENGNIATISGIIDPDSKKITSTVSWNFTPTRSNTVQYIAYLTNWQTARGNAGLGGSCSEAANCLIVNTDNAVAQDQKLRYITLENSDPNNTIIIDQMKVSWVGSSASSYVEIEINGNTIWTGNVLNGVQVDIANTSINIDTIITLDSIKFNDTISDATVEIEFIMTDSSIKTVTGISL